MIREIKLIIIFTITLIGCNPLDKTNLDIKLTSLKSDTIIYLTINGIKREFKLSKENRIDFVKFQTFLNKFPLVPELHLDTLNIDINNDDVNEKIISIIESKNGNSSLFSKIIMGDKIIYQDTLYTNNDLAYIDWGNDSIYYKLKPYSSFYDAFNDKKIIEEFENEKLSDGIIEFFLNGVSVDLKKNYDSISVNIKLDSISNELHNYKGKIISTLEHWDRSILIWNKSSQKLELIYTP